METLRNDQYEVLVQKRIAELNADSYLLRHKKSGAKLFLISNDDENKVFNIGFRTPVTDSTGVPHIMEHTVLCGSDKYPLKDPFVELVKGSLNTFLNAMTYNDKTVYPVASCNDQDFRNLMDVYLDAVFHPNIYKDIRIFKQEGWHYELENEEGPLTINGVVYNEMKGVYSSAESLLDEAVKAELFPDSIYSKDSGGHPEVIPSLTYEQYLDFHRTYYHPSNSFIYLYGNMDVEESLAYLDQEYLKAYDCKVVDSEIKMQKPFPQVTEKEEFYSIGEDEDPAEKTYLSWAKVVGDDLDPVLYIAFQILEYALLGAPGAPLKQALIDAGIGTDVFGGYESGILQPVFSVVAKNTEKEKKEAFLSVIQDTLTEICTKGMNPRSLESGLNYFEFKYREADFGPYPKGLMYGLQCFDSWLYKEDDPYMHLEFEESFRILKEKKNQGYFEELIRKYLLENTHGNVLVLSPKQGLEAEQSKKLTDELETLRQSMTSEERKALIKETKDLKDYQQEPTPKEALELLPMLKREDIGKKAAPFHYKEKTAAGVPALHSDVFTNGITYLKVLFNAADVAPQDLHVLSFLTSTLGSLSTEKHSYLELFNDINIETGGISTRLDVYGIPSTMDARMAFCFSSKVFADRIDKAFAFIHEIMYETVFDDEKRLRELAARFRSRSKESMVSAGHSTSVLRGGSYDSEFGCLSDHLHGVSYYEFLCDLEKHFEERKDALIAKMKELAGKLFTKDRMFVVVTGDAKSYEAFEAPFTAFAENVPGTVSAASGREVLKLWDKSSLTPVQKNEGFKASTQVQYVARCGNFRKAGYEYTGALRILQVILGYDYLWIQIRVKGGAYGVMSGCGRMGDGYFVSYRDPNLSKTSEVFEQIPGYLKSFEADEREMTKYIIGTVSSMDTPLTPSLKGNRDLNMYLSEIPYEQLQRERDQVLGADQEDIRALSDITAAILNTGSICVIGNDTKIDQEAHLFHETRRLP